MKKIAIFILGLFIALSATACSNLANNKEKISMENTMRELVNKNYTCITELFYFGNLPYGDVKVNNDKPIAEVKSDKYKSINDIKTFLSNIYIFDEVERLINNYHNNQPLYFEKDGKLFISVAQSTGAGLPEPWKSFEIDIKDKSENYCAFDAIVKYEIAEKEHVFSFLAVNEGSWKLTAVVRNPNT